MNLPDDIARCNPTLYCPERMQCARNQCPPSNPRRVYVHFDASVVRKPDEPCPMFIAMEPA